ncbi:MAG: tlde1 domain-containing protein [Terriglobales bacterium]
MSTTSPVLPQPPKTPSARSASDAGPAQAKPQGHWEYSQSEGTIAHVFPDGARKLIGSGYSGFGSALDDPAAQDEDKLGPIPRGSWIIGPQQNHSLADGRGTLIAAMPLAPAPGNTTVRKDFWIHGDTAAHNHTASQGCIVLPRDTRNAIARSGDSRLEVVYP